MHLAKGPYSIYREMKIRLLRISPVNMTVKYPANIQLSVNKTCNLHCTFCARQTEFVRNQLANETSLIMPYDYIKKNASLFKKADYINLSADGEPLHHPEIKKIFDLLGTATQKRNIIFVTNGVLLTDELIQQIVKSNIKEIHFSIDSLTEENINFIRPGTNIHQLINIIERINKEKKKIKSPYPSLILRPTFITKTISELPQMVEFCQKYGFSTLLAQSMHIYKPELSEYSLLNCKDMVKQNVEMAKHMGWQRGVDVALDDAIKNIDHLTMDTQFFMQEKKQSMDKEPHDINIDALREKCMLPWSFILIQTNGNVYPCCFSQYLLGNLKEDSWENIWNGKKAKELRKKFMNNILPKECVNQPCGIGKL